jgi:hypothetical protein
MVWWGGACIMPLARLSGINISYQVEVQGEPLVMIMGFTAGLIGMVSLEFDKISNPLLLTKM